MALAMRLEKECLKLIKRRVENDMTMWCILLMIEESHRTDLTKTADSINPSDHLHEATVISERSKTQLINMLAFMRRLRS